MNRMIWCLSLPLLLLSSRISPAETGEKIAFVSYRNGSSDVFVMNSDGSDPTNLTNHPARDIQPCWSPDGMKMAFVSDRRGSYDIYVMDVDGSNPIQLTKHPGEHITPAWSPDGQWIAFASNQHGRYSIYVMEADGSNPIQLTDEGGDDMSPTWSPDGRRIAYSSSRDRLSLYNYVVSAEYFGEGRVEPSDLFIMDADGSDNINVTLENGTIRNHHPRWSPDGTTIIISSGYPEVKYTNFRGEEYYLPIGHELYLFDVNSRQLTSLTRDRYLIYSSPHSIFAPSWSRDGRKIVFSQLGPIDISVGPSDANFEIFAMNADGSDIIQLTDYPGPDLYPVWSPVGSSGTNVTATSWGAVKALFKEK